MLFKYFKVTGVDQISSNSWLKLIQFNFDRKCFSNISCSLAGKLHSIKEKKQNRFTVRKHDDMLKYFLNMFFKQLIVVLFTVFTPFCSSLSLPQLLKTSVCPASTRRAARRANHMRGFGGRRDVSGRRSPIRTLLSESRFKETGLYFSPCVYSAY